ncbi:chain-length determining protein [Vibrio cholerae]|nr:chain-length determining protein [Vibrio cholerae]
MSSLANTSPVQPPQYPHYAYPVNDEIDLKELFSALWQGKWLIIIITLLFSVVAIGYALTAQEYKWPPIFGHDFKWSICFDSTQQYRDRL